MLRSLLTLACSLVLASSLLAQKHAADDSTKEKAWGVLPLPAVAYTPETDFLFGPVVAITYDPPADSITRPTTLSLYAIYTLNKQFYSIVGWNTWSKNNRYNYTGVLYYYDFPELFWGIGNDTPEEAGEFYESKRFEGSLTAAREIRPNTYLGGIYTFQQLWNVNSIPGGLLDAGNVPGAEGGFYSGLGYVFRYDTRVQPLNPKASTYLEINHLLFHRVFGSQANFSRFTVDFRKYWELMPWGEKEHILGMQVTSSLHTGEVPFRMTSAIGGKALRGYYYGRYRDQHYLSAQVEYRMPIWWRISGAAYAGAGTLAPTLAGFGSAKIKPAIGAGLRLLAFAGINLRADLTYGFAVRNDNLYLDVGEAF